MPLKPQTDVGSFQPASTFNFNAGVGAPVSNIWSFGYQNQDTTVTDSIPLTERLKAQIRFEFFNAWNWHIWHSLGSNFVTDASSRSFGDWKGGCFQLSQHPIGWNTWYGYLCKVTDLDVRAQADAMVRNGMKSVGYEYVNIDLSLGRRNG